MDDACKAYEETTKRGAKSYLEPTVTKDENGEIVKAGIHTYGETIHMFVERKNYNGVFMPGYAKLDTEYKPTPTGLKYIDHMVGNVELGAMNKWASFYADVMGFANLVTFDDKDISTEYTALMSKVMTNGNGRIKFPINEPAHGKRNRKLKSIWIFIMVQVANILLWQRMILYLRFLKCVNVVWSFYMYQEHIMIL